MKQNSVLGNSQFTSLAEVLNINPSGVKNWGYQAVDSCSFHVDGTWLKRMIDVAQVSCSKTEYIVAIRRSI